MGFLESVTHNTLTMTPYRGHVFYLTLTYHCQGSSLPVNRVRQPHNPTDWEYPAVIWTNTLCLIKSPVTFLFKSESRGKADIWLDLLADHMNMNMIENHMHDTETLGKSQCCVSAGEALRSEICIVPLKIHSHLREREGGRWMKMLSQSAGKSRFQMPP